jgi:tetratricopeptide (TPR) repeat protein
MKCCLFFVLLFSVVASAQKRPSQAEINKMQQQMAEQLKQLEKDDPETAKMVKQMMGQSQGQSSNKPAEQKPAKKPDLTTVPKRPLTQPEIAGRLKSEQLQLKKQLDPKLLQNIQATVSAAGSTTNNLDNAAASKFYAGSAQEAILMQIQACQKDSNDLLGLNNLAAMYNMTGQEIKALPLLRTLVSQLPGNSIVLNNLGQCYMGLEQKDSALIYLNKCIAIEPHHPEANKTAAVIALAKGNKEAAGRYLENSLRGAFTLSAARQYKALYPEKAVGRFVRPRTKFPDYFNENKFDLPPQCESVDSVNMVRQLHENFTHRMEQLIEQYDALKQMEGELAKKDLKNAMTVTMKTHKPFSTRPFTVSGGFMMIDYAIDRGLRQEAMNRFITSREAEIDSLGEEFRRRTKDVGDCNERKYLANLYMKKAAIIRRDIQAKQLKLEKETFNEMSYWGYLSGPDEHSANAAFYGSIVQYLTALKGMSKTSYASGCEEGNSFPSNNNFNDKAERFPNCPISINIPFVIGDIELSCKNFKLKIGAGVTASSSDDDEEHGSGVEAGAFFTYEKDFESRESTMSLGISLGFEKGKGVASAGIGAKEAIYITFDGDNHVMDAGLEFEANAEASAKFDSGLEYLSTGDVELVRAEAKFGYKIGINSGWTFTDPDASLDWAGNEDEKE